MISSPHRSLPTQHKMKAGDEHSCPSGTQTRDPSNREGSDLSLRPYSHRNRLLLLLLLLLTFALATFDRTG